MLAVGNTHLTVYTQLSGCYQQQAHDADLNSHVKVIVIVIESDCDCDSHVKLK